MLIYGIDRKRYSSLCPKCDNIDNIIKFRINHEKRVVEYECKNGHICTDESFYDFKNYLIRKTPSVRKSFCHKCFSKNESNSYLCVDCNKLFCMKCRLQHLKSEKHNIIDYFDDSKVCHKHNKIYSLFCDYCKENICLDCKRDNHNNHLVKLMVDIIPNNEDREKMEKNAMLFGEKIEEILNYLEETKEQIDKRYKELETYLEFLIGINNKLFKAFNLFNF